MSTGRRALTKDEVTKTLLSFTGPFRLRDVAMFTLLLKSGFRISEALSLRVKDVYQFSQVVDFIAIERKHMKGQKSGRVVPIGPIVKAALSEWLRQLGTNKPDTFVFKSKKGFNKPMGRIQAWKVLKDAFTAAGISGLTGTHSGRKTFAQNIYKRLGNDLIKTSRALGHKSIQSTVSYLAVDDHEINQAILEE